MLGIDEPAPAAATNAKQSGCDRSADRQCRHAADVYLGRYTVEANGLTLVDSTGLNGLGGTGFGFALGQDGLSSTLAFGIQ